MKSYFVPDNFVLTGPQIEWARVKAPWLKIEDQIELWRDHEYKRTYSDWDRVWRNWIRQAIKFSPMPASYKETQLDQPEFIGKERGQSNVVALRQALRGKPI